MTGQGKTRTRATAHGRLSRSLKQSVAAVRLTAPTPGNARRLWSRYQSTLRLDDELARLVCDQGSLPNRGIDGMTEVLSCDDLLATMRMAHCLTFELPSVEGALAPPEGFLLVPYATRAADSIGAFRAYFLGTVFVESGLMFSPPHEASRFHEALNRGNLCYLSEFVSPSNSAGTMALLIAAHTVIVERLFGVPNCSLLGKCLDAVRVAEHRNDLGNQPIKRLATSFGMTKIGEAAQRRPLHLAGREDRASSLGSASTEAELIFGLYMGNTAPVADLVAAYEGYLHASLFDSIAPV